MYQTHLHLLAASYTLLTGTLGLLHSLHSNTATGLAVSSAYVRVNILVSEVTKMGKSRNGQCRIKSSHGEMHRRMTMSEGSGGQLTMRPG